MLTATLKVQSGCDPFRTWRTGAGTGKSSLENWPTGFPVNSSCPMYMLNWFAEGQDRYIWIAPK